MRAAASGMSKPGTVTPSMVTSSTVNGKVSTLDCGTTARRRASSAGEKEPSGRPSSRMAPRVGFSSPVNSRSSVDLPAPLGPISTMTRPGRTVRSTARSSVAPLVMPPGPRRVGDVARFQHVRQPPPTPRLTTMCRKIGAPIRAMTTPSGSSAGRTSMRANMSASSTSVAPSRALPGSTTR